MLRKYNKAADYLANRGKALDKFEYKLEIGSVQHFNYVRGFWDGGHSTNSSEVGIGIIFPQQRRQNFQRYHGVADQFLPVS